MEVSPQFSHGGRFSPALPACREHGEERSLGVPQILPERVGMNPGVDAQNRTRNATEAMMSESLGAEAQNLTDFPRT